MYTSSLGTIFKYIPRSEIIRIITIGCFKCFKHFALQLFQFGFVLGIHQFFILQA